jgi:hypothetical protein
LLNLLLISHNMVFYKLTKAEFEVQYLHRCPNESEIRKSLAINAACSFPGLFSSWDCKYFNGSIKEANFAICQEAIRKDIKCALVYSLLDSRSYRKKSCYGIALYLQTLLTPASFSTL